MTKNVAPVSIVAVWGLSLQLVLLAAVGCKSDEATSQDAGRADASTSKRVPLSVFDAGIPTAGEYCSALVAAECDGNEDCDHGQVCCGMLNGSRYESVRCQDECESAAGGIPVCHPGETCPDPQRTSGGSAMPPVCRRSSFLPSYLAICAAPSSLVPTDFTGEAKAARRVNCGPDSSCGPGQQCCVLGSWNAATQSTEARAGYCAPVGEKCSCGEVSDADAGE